VAWLDAATASDSVTYKPEVGEVAGSSPTSRSVLFLLFILSSLSLFFLKNLRLLPSPSGFCQFLGSVRSSRNARFGLDSMSMVRTLELGSGKPPFLGGLRLRIRIRIRIRLTLSFAFNI
jgi:hypothetical protein